MRPIIVITCCILICASPFLVHSCKKAADDRVLTYYISIVDPEQCLSPGDVVRFSTGTTKSAGSAPSYYWDFGDGTTSTQSAPQHSYTAVGTYGVTLVINNTRTNAAHYMIQVNSSVHSDHTSLAAGARRWNGYRSGYTGDSTLIADTALAIQMVDAGTITFSGYTMVIRSIDTANKVITYAACVESAFLHFYYLADSMTYDYRRQTGKMSGTIIMMHTK